MNDYEGQEYEDTEAQAEAYYAVEDQKQEDQWLKNMEYLEAYGDAELEGQEYIDHAYEYWEALEEADMIAMDADEAEAVNKTLDMLDRDRMARENGEKPAAEWVRRDFKDLLYQYPPLRGLRTSELQAAFLICEETIDDVSYFKRRRLEYLRRWRGRSVPVYRLLLLPDRWFFERWRLAKRQLWKMWRSL